MVNPTISEGLEKYRLGPKLRALRLAKKLGLADLSDHTGLSPALLSKIERGQIHPTLPTLLRIAMVFGVGLDHLFSSQTDETLFEIVRQQDRLRLPDQADSPTPAYFFESLNFPVNRRKLDAYLAEFPAGAPPSAPHNHTGTEFIYVLSGSLALQVGQRQATLGPGDAAHFDSSSPHSYGQAADMGCTAVVVTVPE